MKISSVLKQIILEDSRFEVLYNKLVNPMTKSGVHDSKKKGILKFDTLKKLIFADPTTRGPQNFDVEGSSVEDMTYIKVGKYVQWLVRNYLKPDVESDYEVGSPEHKEGIRRYRNYFMEDLYQTTDNLRTYERIKNFLPQQDRDINKFTISSLDDLLIKPEIIEIIRKKEKGSEDSELKKKARETRKGFEHAGGEIIFEGNDWTVIRISDKGKLGKDAAIWYGGFHENKKKESSWCTSSPGLSYFEGYIKDGPLYVIFPHDDKGEVGEITGLPYERYQIHFPSNQFKDVRDHEVSDRVELLNGRMSELKPFFKEEFFNKSKATSVSGNDVKIIYPQDFAATYIGLYGLEELLNRLPLNMTRFSFENKSSTSFDIDLPENFGRFKDLEILYLSNVIKSLPNSIGNLKNLEYLALPNNKNLGMLPESLSDLPNLMFILVEGCPNVEFPEKLKNNLSKEANGFYNVL